MRIARNYLSLTVLALLRPVARFCLRHGVRFAELTELLRRAFIDEAQRELSRAEKKANASRLSAMTGLTRREVARLSSSVENSQIDDGVDLIGRVLGQWQTDKRFLTKSGEARILSIGTLDSEFHDLVKLVSQDLNPATVLFELERVGAVEHTRQGVRLVAQSFTPKEDPAQGLAILSADQSDLTEAVVENIFTPDEIPNLHARTSFNRIRASALPEIREFLAREGHRFHATVRTFLVSHDQDTNPKRNCNEPLTTVTVSAFSRIEQKKEKL